MNCWPTAWIAAAKAAGLAHGMDASPGQFFVRGGDTMRLALEVFAQGISDAAIASERERLACRLQNLENGPDCGDADGREA